MSSRKNATKPSPQRSRSCSTSGKNASSAADSSAPNAHTVLADVPDLAQLQAESAALRAKNTELVQAQQEMASQLAAVRKENAELRRQLAQTRRAARQVEDIPPRVPEGRADEAEESSDASEPPPEFNAVQICGRMMEVYGAPIPNNIALEKRGHLLDAKMKDFLEVIDRAIQVTDLVSGKTLLKNFQEVQDRYLCVFRESGEKLKAGTTKRFFFEPSPPRRGAPTFCLDFESHEHLVTARPGTRLDGALGLLPPRNQDLLVLYEARDNKLTQMWVAPDREGLGKDRGTGEAVVAHSEIFQKFLEVVKLRLPKYQTHFHNYHEVDSIG